MNGYSELKRSILIVDDNGINRLLPGLILRPFGWDVYEVDDGYAALSFLKNTNVSCVLLDISMPGISGIEVLQFLRADVACKDLKIIAYTAYAKQEDVEHLLSLGFDAVMLKPITSHKLLSIIK